MSSWLLCCDGERQEQLSLALFWLPLLHLMLEGLGSGGGQGGPGSDWHKCFGESFPY